MKNSTCLGLLLLGFIPTLIGIVGCGQSLLGTSGSTSGSDISASDVQNLADGTKGVFSNTKNICNSVSSDTSLSSLKIKATTSGTFDAAGVTNYYTLTYNFYDASGKTTAKKADAVKATGEATSTSEAMDGSINATVYLSNGVPTTAEGSGRAYFKTANLTVEATRISASFEGTTLAKVDISCKLITTKGTYTLTLSYDKNTFPYFSGKLTLPDMTEYSVAVANASTLDFKITIGSTTISTQR